MLIIERGPLALTAAAQTVLAKNMEMFGPADAVVNLLLTFDRYVAPEHVVADLLVETWPQLATDAGRAVVTARWPDLRGWIEDRLDGTAARVRHLVALLAAAPFDDALPLLRQALSCEPFATVFEPLLVVDRARAARVLASEPAVRAAAEPLALQIAAGGSCWDNSRFAQPRDHALVACFADSVPVWKALIATVEDRREEMWQPHWEAVAAHVRHDLNRRFGRAATAAIRSQLYAAGPGSPGPPAGLATITELDPQRMIATIIAYMPEVQASQNALCFLELFRNLGPRARDVLPHLVAWKAPADWRVREALPETIAAVSALTPA
jgi:hypothetical protein